MQEPEFTLFLTAESVQFRVTERATVGVRFLLDVSGLRPGTAPALELTPDEADALAQTLLAKAALARSKGDPTVFAPESPSNSPH